MLRLQWRPASTPMFLLFLAIVIPSTVSAGETPGLLATAELSADFTGDLATLVETGAGTPRSLASADFDEDGVPDLVVGYGVGEGGLVALHRGNIESIYPKPGEEPGAAFLPIARVFAVAGRADHVGAGDFDGDGHFDLVSASSGGAVLELSRGDGTGRFAPSEAIDLGGALSAMTVGEVNRRDGLADIVVGVDRSSGPGLLVFESPAGALRGAPEIVGTFEKVTSIELGNFDGDSFRDIVAVTEFHEITVAGRDRRLSLGARQRAAVPEASVSAEPVSSSSRAKNGATLPMTAELGGEIVALVSMRLNRDAIPDFVVITDESPTPIVVKTLSRATFTVDSTADDADFSTADGVCDTDDSAGDGPCTLRAAIEQANASPGTDAIEFDIAGTGPHTIQPLSQLPVITEAVTIDATTEPDFAGTPVIEIDGSATAALMNGFAITGGDTVIRGFAINRMKRDGGGAFGSGVYLNGAGNNIVEGNFIGTDPSGTTAHPSEFYGIWGRSGTGNTYGGTTAPARNLVSGQFVNIAHIEGNGASIQGNYVGTDITGTSSLHQSAASGIYIASMENFGGSPGDDHTVGGTAAGAGNVLSGMHTGIELRSGTSGNLIQGNLIGTGPSGTIALPNSDWGIRTYKDENNTIGGTSPATRNVISVNAASWKEGLLLQDSPGITVQGNYIGTDITGVAALPCGWGIRVVQTLTAATIGGASPGAGNVVVGCVERGISLWDVSNVTVQGNNIGIDAAGAPLGNGTVGILIQRSDNVTIGGAATGEGNIIAHNGGNGIELGSGTDVSDPGIEIVGNTIYSNGLLGIDLNADGVTANDSGDPDTGSNGLQNFPVITGVANMGALIEGTLNSLANTEYELAFYSSPSCDASGYGEGAVFLGTDTVTTDALGDASFSTTPVVFVSVGDHVTATATDPDGSTSEFSACFEFTPSADLQVAMDDGVTEVLPGGQLTYTIVVSNAGPEGMPDATFGGNLGFPLSCSTTCVPAGGATCSPGPMLGDIEEDIALPVGGTATYTAVCDVDPSAVGIIEASAGIDPPEGGFDPDWNNNGSTDIDTVLPVDWGDAPDPAYPTLPGSDGARHQIAGGLHLGSTVDADPGGQPTVGADGDDIDGSDDEDGVTFTGIVMTGYTGSLEVSASAIGLLNVWLDFDGNGSWLDSGEQIFADELVGPGVNPLNFAVPASATPGDSYARFRLDSAGGLTPTGFAADGEVEDELVEIRFSTVDVIETGQTTSYAAGDDGAFQIGEPWPDPRFTDNGDGSITDELTGLTWGQDNVNPGPAPCNPGVTRNWFDSLSYVDCLNTNSWLGHTDWRMPNIVELGSLVHYQVADHRPWWNSQGFTMTSINWWWSSTNDPNGLAAAYTLSAVTSFSTHNKLAVTGGAVWPVRGGNLGDGATRLRATGQERCWNASYSQVPCAGTGQDGDHRAGAVWPVPRFEVSGECVTDRLTGLTWTRDANPFGHRSWYDALDDALGLSLCGYDDWRLPTVRELRTLYHYDTDGGSVYGTLSDWWQASGFVNITSRPAWSGTTSAYYPFAAWDMYSEYDKDTDTYNVVWPVRGGIQTDTADLSVLMTDSADPVDIGDTVVYTVDVSNLGPSAAADVTVAATLPAGAVFVSASGAGWTCDELDLVVTCDMASLGVAVAAPITIEITTPPTFGPMTAAAVVDSSHDDPAGENNGAAEDTLVIAYDFGDAPDPTYPTLLATDGARHLIGGGLLLGATVDDEPDGQPSAGADGDDLAGVDDEDGVTFTSVANPGGTAVVDVDVSEACLLNAWIDFNADGDWDDAGEQIFTDEALAAGVNSLGFAVPATASVGVSTAARFRVSSAGGLAPTGSADDGEVEDSMITVEELDFGDVPDPTYPTLLASNGARHIIGGPLYLGSLVDADPDGQPSTYANGDDNDPQGNDEDGVSFITWLVAGQTCTIRVTASVAGVVNAWIDFNADGDWEDAGEQIFIDVAVVAGPNNLDYSIPLNAATDVDTFARFRLNSTGGLSFDGLAPDGEVEDRHVMISALDYGDAPDPTYPTLHASDGARHIIVSGFHLGASVDLEGDGQPTAAADGDDIGGADDEDGVVFTSGLGRGLTASLEVTASAAGLLSAWIDFNADGDWDDAGEQVFTDLSLAAGVNPLSVQVPVTAALGSTYARFRFSLTPGLFPNGYATHGEVEDYMVEIVEGPDLFIEMVASSVFAPSGRPLTHIITVTNNGPLPASSVTVTDTLPGELIFVSSTPGAPDCSFAAGTLTCDLGTMAPTDTAQITLETVLDHPVWGSLGNTSSVTADEFDPITANNTVTVDTTIALFVDGFESGDLSAWD